MRSIKFITRASPRVMTCCSLTLCNVGAQRSHLSGFEKRVIIYPLPRLSSVGDNNECGH